VCLLGPGQDDSYNDTRSDYAHNEPAVDYNAGFSGLYGRACQGQVAVAAATSSISNSECLRVLHVCPACLARIHDSSPHSC